MDFLDPAKKRAHKIRLYVGYALMAVIVLITTLILLFASYGFDIDRKTGAIIQNGLIFLSAYPEPADIYLNGNLHKSQTDSRLTLPSGEYAIELRRNGYRSWKQTVNLEGGSIERLVYPVLFPEQPVVRDVQLYASPPGIVSASPDRRWLLVQQPGSLVAFDLFDIVNETVPSSVVTLPADTLTASNLPRTLQPVEWSTDNRHLLMKHTYGDSFEFIMLDTRAPASSFNVNRHFNQNPTQVALRDKRFDRLYLFDEASGKLSNGDARSRAVGPLLERVLAFKPHGDDQLLYITDKSAPAGQVNVNILDGIQSYTIRHILAQGPYLLDMARFDGRWYVTMASTKDNRVFIYRDPFDQLRGNRFEAVLPLTAFKMDNPAIVAFSDNARFLTAQSGNSVAVHDFETGRRFNFQTPAPLQAGLPAKWMDGHRLTGISGGNIVVFDFNGTNHQVLSPSSHTAFFNRDYTSLFTIAPSKTAPGRSALQQTELKIK